MAGRRLIAAAALMLGTAVGWTQESAASFGYFGGGNFSRPVLGDEEFFDSGFDLFAGMEYLRFSPLFPYIRAGTGSLALRRLEALTLTEAALGLAARRGLGERLFAGGEADLGVYRAEWGDYGAGGIGARVAVELGMRLSPALRLSASFGINRYFQGSSSLYTGAVAGLRLRILPDAFDPSKTGLRVGNEDFQSLFPVFYSHYDDQAFGSVQIGNGENAPVRNVVVSFHVPEYMSGPTVCAEIDRLETGETRNIPITALFNERILSLTEQTVTRGELRVSYRVLGARREVRRSVDLSVHHRNAMTWEDDRRAAAFVSANDPAVLWFSRFVTAVVRDRFRTGIDRNIQQAVGIFEAMKLFGLSYVVDPNSAYVAAAENAAVVDYLQYPHQTLFYRGGDCDDLSILYASLLQSVGIRTAFITIPGHIYMAFATELSEEAARRDFYDQDLLIIRNGVVWVPVEITMVKDGFIKAWRVGAKGWKDNAAAGSAGFFPMVENWKEYPPVAVSDVNPRFLLPDEAATMRAFDLAMDRHVAREIDPRIARYRAGAAGLSAGEADNGIGLIYARVGMLNEAWNYFTQSAEAGFSPAWTNLANIAFIRRDYQLAADYYRYAEGLDAYNLQAVLGIARSEYELERFADAEAAYGRLRAQDGELASRYTYLVSLFGGSGRAWSLAERADAVEWMEKIPARPIAPKAAVAALAPTQEPAPAAPVPSPAPAAAPEKAPEPVPAAVVEAPPEAEARAQEVPQAAAAEAAPPAAQPEIAAPLEPEQAAEPIVAAEAEPAEEPAIAELAEARVEGEAVSVVDPEPQSPAPAAVAEAPPPAESAPAPIAEAAPPAETAPAPAAPEEPPRLPAVEPPQAAIVPAPQAPVPAAPAAPRPAAPPRITRAAPVDADIAERAAEGARVAAAAEQAAAPERVALPPAISRAAPADADIAERAAEGARRAAAQEPEAASVSAEPESARQTAPLPFGPAASTPQAAPALAAPQPALEVEPAAPAEADVSPPEPAAPVAPPAEEIAAAVVSAEAELPTSAGPAPVPAPIESPVAATAETAAPVEAAPAEIVRAVPDAPAPVAAEPAEALAPVPEIFAEIAPPPEAAVGPAAAEAVEVAAAPAPAPEPIEAASETAEPVPLLLKSGFTGFRLGPGTWNVQEEAAAQSDGRQYYAKIADELQSADAVRVRFSARSTVSGWTGFGIHLSADRVRTLGGYGAGESLLVWFTSDKKANPDAPERIQLYRSYNDIDMRLIADYAYPGVFSVLRDFSIEFVRSAGTVRVDVDGIRRIERTLNFTPAPGSTIIFRALRGAEFRDFRAESISPAQEGTHHEK